MNYTVLITGTLVIIVFSWFYSVKQGRYHGIPRFFSFESIFVLTVMNIKIWFHDPFSFLQVLSWIALILSAYLGIAGIIVLKRKGRPGINFENTTVLVKSNIYKYIRHPLYLSLFLLGTGVMLKDPGYRQLIIGIINFIAIYITAIIEEDEMKKKFGNAYSEYIAESKMFIPFLL